MDLTPLEALRALGIPDDEIRALSGRGPFTADELGPIATETRSKGDLANAARWRIDAAILRAAEQLGPERTPVTREVEPGERIAHPDESSGCRLIGWASNGRLVYEGPTGNVHDDDPDGWYVVEGDR